MFVSRLCLFLASFNAFDRFVRRADAALPPGGPASVYYVHSSSDAEKSLGADAAAWLNGPAQVDDVPSSSGAERSLGATSGKSTTRCYVGDEGSYVYCKPSLLCAYIRRFQTTRWGRRELRMSLGCANPDVDVFAGACKPLSVAKPWETLCFCEGAFCNGGLALKPCLFLAAAATCLLWCLFA